jgi:cysteine-rich repeat protein
VATGCGNGQLTPPEQCDDGNQTNGDGCDQNCRATGCGNGVVTSGEQCDDGNRTSGDGCDENCSATQCGNGVVTAGEQCDDGNQTNGDGCEANCTFPGCGNGTLNDGEDCDDGNDANGDGCDVNCSFTGCGNGVVTEGETCDDGNVEDLDGCSGACQVEDPPQSPDQIGCILEVNSGVARVARAQTRNHEACLSAAAKGKLGAAPSAFDACLLADLQGRVAEAEQKLEQGETQACSPGEPPALALGDDRLSGLPAASELPAALVRDVFGAPAAALSSREARQAARCQREVLKRTNGLFDAIWSDIRHAQATKLEGRRTAPATTDADLSAYLQEELAASRRIVKSQERLLRGAATRCQGVELEEIFPGCSPKSFLLFAACTIRTTRCRACELLMETNRRLVVDCDAFDDGGANASCTTAP